MKGIKLFYIIAMIVILCVGWITFSIDTGTNIVSNKSSVSTADQYVEEGLYQRAILKYKEALDVKDSEKTWEKMFKAYELRYKEDTKILSDYITDLENALEIYPKNLTFLQKLYDLHMVSNDIESAYKCLNTAVKNGVKDKEIIALRKKLKYSYELDYNTYTNFNGISASTYAVSNGETWGYIDSLGETLVDFKYPFASSVNSDNVRICETKLGSRLLDSTGMVLGIFDFKVVDAGLFANGLIPASNGKTYSYYNSFSKKQFGDYEYAGTFVDGLAAIKKDGKYTLVDVNGKVKSDNFVDIVIDDNGKYLSGDVMIASKENGKYQIYDKEGKNPSKFSATKMDICKSDGIIAFEKDGKWGYVNTSGKIVIEPVYDNAKSFSNGLAAVCKGGKWGFINSSNELVIDYKFAGADYFNSDGTCMVRGDSPNADDELLWQLLVLNLGL